MSVAFLSQMPFSGKVPRDFLNMRTEFAQMCALDADHYPLLSLPYLKLDKRYDNVILLIPKTKEDRIKLYDLDVVSLARNLGNKIWFMQEGPSWIFQDLPIHQQFWHYNLLTEVDGILTENDTDIPYFRGLVSKDTPVFSIPSLMILEKENKEPIYDFSIDSRHGCIIGGNFVRWYGGFDSYITAKEFQPYHKIYSVSMGRKQKEEDQIEDIEYLPYMQWSEWIIALNKFKFGVHLMPTIAAGTFAMNCGMLGIPCIGYNSADTQRIIHPELSVELGDLGKARRLAKQLRDDKAFYKYCSVNAKELWYQNFSENVFKQKMKLILL